MIQPEFQPIVIFLIALFSTIFALPKLVNITKKINLMDQPDRRKVHATPRPLVGGLGFVLSACFASALIVPATGLRGFFAGLALMLVIGFFDDLKELGHRQKFIGQIIAATLLIYLSQVRLISFGDILGIGELTISAYWVSFLISLFCILGVINSINLIDGLDGLAGGVGFVAFIIFATHASFAGNHTLLLLNLAFAGALLGFLRFNWHPAVVFMGDAGSLSLGFVLAFMAIAMSQGNDACIRPITALLILAVPITDTLTIMTKRVIQGRSPFHPDRHHLHHIFMRYGLSRLSTVKIIIGTSIVLGCSSLLSPIYNIPDWPLFLVFVFYFAVYFISSFFILDLLRYSLKCRRKHNWGGFPCRTIKYFSKLLDPIHIIDKDARYDVTLPIHCYTPDHKNLAKGTILNISNRGFRASIPEITTLGTQFLVDINPCKQNSLSHTHTQFMAEHLWISTVEGGQLHGFIFVNLTTEQKADLDSLMNKLGLEKIKQNSTSRLQQPELPAKAQQE